MFRAALRPEEPVVHLRVKPAVRQTEERAVLLRAEQAAHRTVVREDVLRAEDLLWAEWAEQEARDLRWKKER